MTYMYGLGLCMGAWPIYTLYGMLLALKVSYAINKINAW